MTFSAFIAYLTANRRHLRLSVILEVEAEAKRQMIERMTAGRADGVLCFRDLIERCEASLAGS